MNGHGQSQQPQARPPPTSERQDSSNAGKRMLEGVYSVESRADQPQSRKRIRPDETKGASTKTQKFNSSGTGIVGDYMNPAKDPDAADKPTLFPAGIVDLTNDDDDDDDVQVTGSNSTAAEKEVCYGAIYESVDAFYTPKGKFKTTYETPQWPPMACTLQRKREDTRTTLIQVVDPHGLTFANCASKLAKGLAPIMDNFPRVRLSARLLNRPKLPNEWPHQSCSQTMKLMIIVYGRRGDAEKVGRLLGQANIWIMDTTMGEKGIEMFNPQKQKSATKPYKPPTRPGAASSATYDTVSEEEAAQTVTKIFEHFASEKLPETEAPATILTPLLSHQKQALTFMLRHESHRSFGDEATGNSTLWQKKYHKSGKVYYEEAVCSMTTDAEPPQVSGGLLADVMGLGKTLESLTLIAETVPQAAEYARSPLNPSHQDKIHFSAVTKGTLIVCPMSTVANWENQIREHLDKSITWYTHHGTNRPKNPFELCKYDIVITTFGTLQSESRRGESAVLRKIKWFRVILDEAHTIREPSAQQSQACYELEASRRWALTGTPIQNKLADLGSLCQFLQLFPYHTVANFQYYIGKRAAAGDPGFLLKLRIFIDSFTLRRQRDQIDLPPKQDKTIAVDFSDSEFKLHDFFRKRAAIAIDEMTKDETQKKQKLQVSVLQGITTLRLISAHGREMLRDVDLDEYKGANVDEPIDLDADDDGLKMITQLEAYETFKMMSDAGFDLCRNCEKQITAGSPTADVDDGRARAYIIPCKELICPECFKKHKAMYDAQEDSEPLQCPFCSTITASQYIAIEGPVGDTIEKLQESRESTPVGSDSTYGGPHSKTQALLQDIETMMADSVELEGKGEPPLKCVIFSEFTSHLTLIGRALKDKGYRTERIDGSMSLPQRKRVLELLDQDNSVKILLASVKAAGQGLNLTAASRAFIMEPLWNPAAEAQAVDRIYRIGQTRPVVVRRYHMKNSIEEVIMTLADKKQKLADLSLNRNHTMLTKKEQREAHYNEIKALFQGKKR